MTPTNCLLLASALFAIGAYGVLSRRNILIILMSVEIMLNAANLVIVTFARANAGGNPAAGQVFVLLNMAVAAAEVAVGLALLIAFFRNKKTVDAGEMDLLKE